MRRNHTNHVLDWLCSAVKLPDRGLGELQTIYYWKGYCDMLREAAKNPFFSRLIEKDTLGKETISVFWSDVEFDYIGSSH